MFRASVAAFALYAAPLAAQDAPPPAPGDLDAEADGEEIVVTGQRERGAVIGDIPPEVRLTPADIRSYGATSIADLLQQLGPLVGSARGRGGERPVILLNGRRISGFTEIRDLPSEAIARIDILPEEVALKYGFQANQRVVNFVLRNRFRATTVELEGGGSTGGGGATGEGDVDFLAIDGDKRFELNLEYERGEPLRESERRIDRSDLPGLVDQGPFRTLLPTRDTFAVNVVAGRNLVEGVALTINPRIERSDTRALLGLPTSGGARPRAQDRDILTGHLGTTIQGGFTGWQWTFTGNYDRVETGIATDGELGARERARSVSSQLAGDFTINGAPVGLPAGDVSTTLTLAASTLDFASRSFRRGAFLSGGAARDIGQGQISIDVPIASRRRGVLDAIGSLSVNGNLQLRRLSDFGTLATWGAGLTWSPIATVDLIASYTDEQDAPSPQQLADPVVATPGVRVFDFVAGRPVVVTQIGGGNPDLAGDARAVWKLGLTVRPKLEKGDLSLTANYVRSRLGNPIFALPNPTPALEAAFPGRFVRDAAGELVSVDVRPVNFARQGSEQLRWGVNLSWPLKADPKRLQALREAGVFGRPGRPGGPRSGAGGGGGGGGRGGGQFGGRLQFALFHSWALRDRILIGPGGPALDLLGGDAIGARGGSPRHRLELQAGLVQNGLGARLSANWQSATTVRGGLGVAQDALRFGDLATVNLRVFANLGVQPALVRDNPWLRGTRVTLRVDNLFNARQRVTDGSGAVPLSYQPALLDPLGRTVHVQLRKLFF